MYRSFGRLVSIIYRKNQAYLDIALKPYKITASELAFITSLYREDGVSQEQLSSFLAIDKSATAKAVKSLIDKGYIVKERNPKDKRAYMIYLTDFALQQKAGITAVLKERNRFLTEGIEDEVLENMFSALESVAQKVESLLEQDKG